MKKTAKTLTKNTKIELANNPVNIKNFKNETYSENKMNNTEQLESLIVSIGNILSMTKSLTKCIDLFIDDEINFKKNDIENLLSILKNMLDDTSEQFEKLEIYLNI